MESILKDDFKKIYDNATMFTKRGLTIFITDDKLYLGIQKQFVSDNHTKVNTKIYLFYQSLNITDFKPLMKQFREENLTFEKVEKDARFMLLVDTANNIPPKDNSSKEDNNINKEKEPQKGMEDFLKPMEEMTEEEFTKRSMDKKCWSCWNSFPWCKENIKACKHFKDGGNGCNRYSYYNGD